jgi:Tfp pilus assembly protein PilF
MSVANHESNLASTARIDGQPSSALELLLAEVRSEFAAGRLEKARLLCLAGLSDCPDTPALLTVLGWVDAQRGDQRSAEAMFRHALCHAARSFDARAGLAAVLAAGGRFAEAEPHYVLAIALHADDADTRFNYGCTLIALRQFDEAIDQLQHAIQQDSAHGGAIHNLAVAHAQLGHWDAAIDCCNRALALDENAAQSQLLRGMARVAQGEFAEGWDDYEARGNLNSADGSQLGLPVWDGDPQSVQSLVVVPEQGIGTQLMLASCLSDLLERVPRVTIACDPRLVGLMKRSFPSAAVVVDGLLPALVQQGGYDAYVMAGSLPRVFRRSATSFPGEPYLAVDSALQAHWHKRLAELGGGLRVGVAWEGGAGLSDTRHRYTDPDSWWPLVTLPDVQWINLQHDARPEELDRWHQLAGSHFHDLPELDKKFDLESVAALISKLDLVITVVNSTAHIAGAVGTPTWTLVPAGGEWRWQSRGQQCLWHNSVRLFRQQRLDDWTNVFRQLRRELVATRRSLSNQRSGRAA